MTVKAALRVAFEEGRREARPVDAERDRPPQANVGERASIEARHEIREVRAGPLDDAEPVEAALERRRERRGC